MTKQLLVVVATALVATLSLVLVGCGGGGFSTPVSSTPIPPSVGTVTGVLKSAITGVPVAEGTVSVVGTSMQVVSDTSGRFQFGNVPNGTATISVTASNYIDATANVTVSGGPSSLEITLQPVSTPAPTPVYGPSFDIEGTMSSASSGRLICEKCYDNSDKSLPENVRGTIKVIYPTQLSEKVAYTGPGSSGYWKILDVRTAANGTFWLEWSAPGFKTESWTLTPVAGRRNGYDIKAKSN